MKTALIDGDFVAWVIAWQPDDVARRTVNYIAKAGRDVQADRVIVCLSDASHRYFRHDLYPDYKTDRSLPPVELPTAFKAIRDNFPHRELPGLEADDVMGILATHPSINGEVVIVAVDKDMLTIPGTHFNPRDRGTRFLTHADAAFNHMRQTLMGDSGDGYPGCPGVGPKTVGKILWGTPSQWWAQVVCAFKGKGLTEDDALLQARLARILRAGDYCIESRTVIPWVSGSLLVCKGVAA